MRFRARVYAMSPDGEVERVSPSDGIHYQAAMHPDGGAVIFYGGSSGLPRLWRKDLRTGYLEAVTEDDSGARHGTYSWDGTMISFVSDRDSPTPGERIEDLHPGTRRVPPDVHLHLYVARADGSAVRQVTEGPYRDLRPTFTPDGHSLVFASDREEGPTLWRVDIEGSAPPRPIWQGSWGYRPWCTPDGESVVYYGPDGDRHRLFQLDLGAGSARPVVADDRGMTHGPFVPADGGCVLSHSTRGGEWGLWEFPLREGEPPTSVTPTGFGRASHPTRAADGTTAFDVVETS